MRTTSLSLLVLVACADSDPASPDAAPAPDVLLLDATSLDANTTDAGCVPTSPATEVCDQLDNDCNGFVDDVDEGGDGLYDCQRIALFGGPGTFGSSNFLAWLSSNGSDVMRLQDTGGPVTLTADLLDDFDVIVLDNLVREYSLEEANLLRDWVVAGGGLMVLSGYTGSGQDLTEPNSLLAGIGLALIIPLTSGPVTTFVAHPVTDGITSVTFSGGFFVDEVEGVTGGENLVVATINDMPVGTVQERGEGRVFVWGDEWITFDSEWNSMPQIQSFWANILGWLGGFV